MMEENVTGIDGERNQEERSFFYSASWWSPEFVSTCLENEKLCVSIGLCSLSAVLWVIACLLLLCKRCRTKERNVGDTATSALYCFLGNLSGTVGAFLSNQLTIQVFMGVLLVTLDVLRLIFIILPFSGRTERRIMITMKRRRQNIFALSLPLVLGVGIFACHGLYHQHGESAPVRRRLLSLDLQDNSEILGYALGLLAFVIGWTSKLPSLTKAALVVYFYLEDIKTMILPGSDTGLQHLERKTSAVPISFGMLCVLANGLYGSAILAYDASAESALRALPWLLSSFGCAAFDLLIVVLCCVWKFRGLGLQPWDPTDTQSLLGSSPTDPPCPKNPDSKMTSLQKLRNEKSLKKAAEIGRYMDINIHPVQPVPKAFLKELKISREGQAGVLPPRRTGEEVKTEDPSSSDSSTASSSLHPELEWDFEDANGNWNKVRRPEKRPEAFPLRDWRAQFGKKPTCQTKSDSEKRVGGSEERSADPADDQCEQAPGTSK